MHNRTCPCIYASLCGFLIGGEIWQVRSLPRPLRLLSYWGRWYDLLSPDKGQNATVPPLQVTQREKKDNSTRFLVFFQMFTTKKVNKPMNTLLHCLKWDVNQMIFFWTKARRGNELPYKRRHKRELLHDVTWSEGTHQFKAMNICYNWMEIFYFFEFFVVTFFFQVGNHSLLP